MQFMQFSAIFAMPAFLATLLTPWYSEGRIWECCDTIHILGYRRTFFLQPLVSGHGPCESGEMAVSTENGPHALPEKCTFSSDP